MVASRILVARVTTMNKKNDFALVPKPTGALEKSGPGARRALAVMIANALELTKKDPGEIGSQPHKPRPSRTVVMPGEQITQEQVNEWNKLARQLRRHLFEILEDQANRGLVNPRPLWRANKIVLGSRNKFVMRGAQMKGPPRILILDDEEGPRKAWAFILKSWYERIEIAEFADGDSAWQALSKSNFDLFITDIRHPGKSCQAMFKRLSDLRATCQVVVTSASVSQNPKGQWVCGLSKVQSWGPNLKITCLSKPVPVDDFRAAVESALQIPTCR
jgi:CheY-like chemotaxis protein